MAVHKRKCVSRKIPTSTPHFLFAGKILFSLFQNQVSRGGSTSMTRKKYCTTSGNLFMLNVTSDLLIIPFFMALTNSGFVVALQIYLVGILYV